MSFKSTTALTLCLLFASALFAQDAEKPAVPDSLKPWKKSGLGSVNFNQVALSNWAGGGESSVSGGAIVKLTANYKKDKTSWDNSLDMAYGLINQTGSPVVKTDDRLELSSKFGKEANKKWSYSAIFTFRTQFAPGLDDPTAVNPNKISDFLSPGYMFVALGMDYKPNKSLTLFLSPATNKNTIVTAPSLANVGAFGVEAAELDPVTGDIVTPGKHFRAEIGGFLKAEFKTTLMENVDFQTKIDLFSNYINNPQNIDVNWESLLSFKINKYLTASVTTTLIYDDDIKIAVDTDDDGVADKMAPRTQFKEVLAIGFTYKI